jgi:hypothetical protein
VAGVSAGVCADARQRKDREARRKKIPSTDFFMNYA